MDGSRFDTLLLAITRSRSRRDVIRLLTVAVTAGGGLAQVHPASAQATCLANGEPCDPKASTNGCCSGKCSRRRKKCRSAPGQGICTVESPTICAGGVTYCHEPDTNELCTCFVTSRGYSFCGRDGGDCFACETDTNCERRVGGRRGDRCIECAGCGTAFNNRACYSKCPNPA
jgi:hypothetical protein